MFGNGQGVNVGDVMRWTGTTWTAQAIPQSECNVIVATLADLPAPVANIITLAANTIYCVTADVDIGVNGIVMSTGSILQGRGPFGGGIIRSNTAARPTVSISGSISCEVRDIRMRNDAVAGNALSWATVVSTQFAQVTRVQLEPSVTSTAAKATLSGNGTARFINCLFRGTGGTNPAVAVTAGVRLIEFASCRFMDTTNVVTLSAGITVVSINFGGQTEMQNIGGNVVEVPATSTITRLSFDDVILDTVSGNWLANSGTVAAFLRNGCVANTITATTPAPNVPTQWRDVGNLLDGAVMAERPGEMFGWGASGLGLLGLAAQNALNPGYNLTTAPSFANRPNLRMTTGPRYVTTMNVQHVAGVGVGVNVTYTLMKNGVSTGLSLVLAAGSTITGSVTISVPILYTAADTMDIQCVNSGVIVTSPSTILCTVS